jgi:hypothetical protein
MAGLFTGSLPDKNTSGNMESSANVRLRLPFVLPSGQAGLCVSLLQQLASSPGLRSIDCGPSNSSLAKFAKLINSVYLAVLRLHVRLPPLVLGTVADSGNALVRWPRFDAAWHFEYGGLIDGFVVGLHNLRNFIAAHLVSPGPAMSQQVTGVKDPRNGSFSLSLQPLDDMAPLWLIINVLATAFGLALSSHATLKQGGGATYQALDKALLNLMNKHHLKNVLGNMAPKTPQGCSPFASLSLAMVLIAVSVGRRALWDHQTAQGSSKQRSCNDGCAVVAQIHGFVAAALRSVLLLGIPLHPCCLPLAAWVGSRELLEVIALCDTSGHFRPPVGLLIWASRGAYANPQLRQVEVIRWLLAQRAQVDERDKDGWSVLEWACWSGAESVVALALRAGLSPSPCLRMNPERTVPPPMALAVSSRAQGVVNMLLRAACDPHIPIAGSGCGPLLLAVQRGEYGLGCRLMQGVPFVAIDTALTANLDQSFNVEEDGSSKSYATTQATVVLIDSFRRFARAMAPRSGDEPMLAMSQTGVRNLPSLGPHPEEGLYSSGRANLNGIQHPYVMELPKPKFKVGHEFRPQVPPHWWVQKTSASSWRTAYNFIECCLRGGFKPDGAVISQALPMLPAEAKKLVQHMVVSTTANGLNNELGAHGFDTVRALRQLKMTDLDDNPQRAPYGLERSSVLNQKVNMFSGSDDKESHILPERVVDTLDSWHDYGPYQEATDLPQAEGQQAPHVGGFEYDPSQDLKMGPWNPVALNEELTQKAELEATTSLPLLRIVVLGCPCVGKSHVARCLQSALGIASPETDAAWLTTKTAKWPTGQDPRLIVSLWDGSAAPLPGLLRQLGGDPTVALMLMWVVDAEVDGAAEKAEACLADCLEAANSASEAAPRVSMLVENVFSGTTSPPNATKYVKSGARCHAVRGSLQASEGIANLRDAFNAACKDVADDLARKPRTAASIGNVLPQLQKAKGTSRPIATLRGDASMWDPRSVSWAWAAVRASAGFLSEGAVPGFLNEGRGLSRCEGAVVSMERLIRVLATPGGAANSGHDKGVAERVRSLADVAVVCPQLSCALVVHHQGQAAVPWKCTLGRREIS